MTLRNFSKYLKCWSNSFECTAISSTNDAVISLIRYKICCTALTKVLPDPFCPKGALVYWKSPPFHKKRYKPLVFRFQLDLVIRTFDITKCDYLGLSHFLDQIRDLWHWVSITLTVFISVVDSNSNAILAIFTFQNTNNGTPHFTF